MRVYRVLNIKDLRALLSYILIGELIKERLAKDKERYASFIKKQSLLLAFFRPWTGRLVFQGLSKGF
jgi:hypothetical protein